jgi:hypothetical protein
MLIAGVDACQAFFSQRGLYQCDIYVALVHKCRTPVPDTQEPKSGTSASQLVSVVSRVERGQVQRSILLCFLRLLRGCIGWAGQRQHGIEIARWRVDNAV